MVAVRRASIPAEQLDCRSCSAARLARLDARKWHLPKELYAETTFDESKISPQRAPDGGGAKGRVIDNRWITPCAPPLPPAAFMYAA